MGLFAFLVVYPSPFSQRLVILPQFCCVFVLSSSHGELARAHVLGYVPALRGRPQGLAAPGTDLITLTPQLGASPNPNARAVQEPWSPPHGDASVRLAPARIGSSILAVPGTLSRPLVMES